MSYRAPGAAAPRRHGLAGWLRFAAAVLAAAWLGAGPARGAPDSVTPEMLDAAFPGAERLGAFTGEPAAAPVYKEGLAVGYLFSTQAVVGSVGFSGKPIDILVGLDTDGRIAGAFLRRHNEPILVIGIPHKRLRAYVSDFAGLDVRAQLALVEAEAPAPGLPDVISGASISSLVIRDAILRAARVVARSRGLLDGGAPGARLDREFFAPAGWRELMADGSLVRLRLTRGAVARAFRERGAAIAATGVPGAKPDDLFIDLSAGLITPPRVGQNLLGRLDFNRLASGIGVDDQAILIAGQGLYSFKGTRFVRSGLFDRIQLVQGETTIRLTKAGYRNLERLRVADAPELREIGVFVVPADTGFDPLAPWRLELLVGRETESGGMVHVSFGLDYELPARYRLPPVGAAAVTPAAAEAGPEAQPALWQRIWRERIGRILAVGVILLLLTAILVFQDAVARNRQFYRITRLAFLGVTLVWIGWYAGAQLSVVNVLTFAHSLLTDFRWEFFLLEPTIFILWGYVAVAMLFWGRGVFCGWLCPFGALQELLNEGARALRVPQIAVPFAVHERLWPVKYIIFLGLFAVSLHSTNLAVLGAEIEPFKTVISLRFLRHWPFVVYALALLLAGLTIERFFCRYLCPLGAALAIPARLRMFEWLKRRHQCGRECNICALRCTVQAIHPNGAINPNECIHCLNCQTLYYDPTTCPPLIARRKRREGRAALKAAQAAK
jgi:transcriptional regulator of nitric oxide reductase